MMMPIRNPEPRHRILLLRTMETLIMNYLSFTPYKEKLVEGTPKPCPSPKPRPGKQNKKHN